VSKVDELKLKIETESAAISRAEQRKTELAEQRAQALEDGDDARVDKIDAEIAAAETGIVRARERIGILERRVIEAQDAAVAAELDALAASLNDDRAKGEKLIREYQRHATAIAEVLQHLAAIDTRNERGNLTLQAAGRETVPGPNAIRCRVGSRTMKTVRRRVGLGEPEHPMHNVAIRDPFTGVARHPTTHQEIPAFGEFDVPTLHVVPSHYPAPLHKEVRLPRVDADAPDIWPTDVKPADEQAEQSGSLLSRVRSMLGRKAA